MSGARYSREVHALDAACCQGIDPGAGARLPDWLRDQMRAAAREVHQAVLAVARQAPGATARWGRFAAHPAWLRLSLLDTLLAWQTGQAVTCVHDPCPTRPAPVQLAAWRARHVACLRCFALLAVPAGSIADRTCDGCGHRCAGPAARDGIHAGLAAFGPVVVLYGVCPQCRDDFAARGLA